MSTTDEHEEKGTLHEADVIDEEFKQINANLLLNEAHEPTEHSVKREDARAPQKDVHEGSPLDASSVEATASEPSNLPTPERHFPLFGHYDLPGGSYTWTVYAGAIWILGWVLFPWVDEGSPIALGFQAAPLTFSFATMVLILWVFHYTYALLQKRGIGGVDILSSAAVFVTAATLFEELGPGWYGNDVFDLLKWYMAQGSWAFWLFVVSSILGIFNEPMMWRNMVSEARKAKTASEPGGSQV